MAEVHCGVCDRDVDVLVTDSPGTIAESLMCEDCRRVAEIMSDDANYLTDPKYNLCGLEESDPAYMRRMHVVLLRPVEWNPDRTAPLYDDELAYWQALTEPQAAAGNAMAILAHRGFGRIRRFTSTVAPGGRTIREINNAGAVYVTEDELAWLCAQASLVPTSDREHSGTPEPEATPDSSVLGAGSGGEQQ